MATRNLAISIQCLGLSWELQAPFSGLGKSHCLGQQRQARLPPEVKGILAGNHREKRNGGNSTCQNFKFSKGKRDCMPG